MEHYLFTNKELLYLSLLLGMANIWGINNDFENQTEESISLDKIYAQDSISGKGYTSLEINDKFRLCDDLFSLLKICKNWKNMIILTSSDTDNNFAFERYFVSGQKIVRLTKKMMQYDLSYITKRELRESLESFFPIVEQANKNMQSQSIITSAKRIRTLSNLRRNRLIDELQRIGCNDNFSNFVADAVQGKVNSNEITVLTRERNVLFVSDNFSTHTLNSKGLIMTPEKSKNRDNIRFAVWNRKTLCERVETMVSRLNIEDELNG